MEQYWISLCALIISLLSFLRNGRREDRGAAAAQAALETKLDSINSGVTDIRVDIRRMQTGMAGLESRVIRTEERSKSNSHRLDALERKEKRTDVQ